MNSTLHFITQNPFGVTIIAIVSSIIGGMLYDLLNKSLKKTTALLKKERFVKKLTKIGESFCFGYRSTQAKNGTSFQQSLYVGDFIISIIIQAGKILFYMLLAIILLIIFRAFPIVLLTIIVIFSVVVTIRYKKLKRYLKLYEMTNEQIYGKEFIEGERKAMIKYWDSLFKDDDKTKLDSSLDEFMEGRNTNSI